ncbi:skin secretory protein xP2-like [Eriocheir sinensis]|uniref:skin secretory protein xP2-like n=1 Tax=Eriocheir sinensis TaxID=95602 RepID=UPI0021CAC13C|nr:skin secretory protein xP2-like [Eriocheir sinensis]
MFLISQYSQALYTHIQTNSMGNKTSCLKIHAEASLGPGVPSVDALSLSCSASRCWGRGRRRLARFTFPRRGWVCTQGVQVCRGRELQHLPLVGLHHEDPNTAIRVKCSRRGEAVYAATMPLARLLGMLEETVAGDKALLLFTLAGDEDCVATLSFTRSRYARPWACNGRLHSRGGGEWELVGQGDTACLGPREGGCGAPASPGQQELGQGQGWHDLVPADKVDEVSASAFAAVPQPVLRTPTFTVHEYTVPAVHCGDPSASAQDVAMPEVDLGDPSTLALYRALHQVRPEPHQGVPPATSAQNTTVPEACCGDPPPSAEAREAVPETDLGDSSSLALYHDRHQTEPAPVEGEPPVSAQDSAVPEIDLGESSCLALYYDLHHPVPEPVSDEGNPPASAEAAEVMPDEESLEPVPSAQEASPPGPRRPWWHAALEGLEVLDLVVYCLLILDAYLR